MKRLLVFLLLMTSIHSAAQTDPYPHGVQVRSAAAVGGYVLFAPVTGHAVYLIDYDGRVINQWQSEHHPLAVYLLENGHLIMSVQIQFSAGATGRIEEYDWEGNLVWDYEAPNLHHDFELMPNGNVLLLQWERIPREEILAMGLNPELMPVLDAADNLSPYDGLILDSVIEVARESKEIIWRWAVSEHLIQDFDPSAPNYGEIRDAPQRINLNYANLRLPSDRIHLNGIDYNAERDEIILSAHYYSEIWVIDHGLSMEEARTEAGDLVYRWGNPLAYRRGTQDERRLFLQHDAQWLPDNSILVFNNGMPIFRPFSTIEQIIPVYDEQGNYAMNEDGVFEPSASVRRYQAPRPRDFYAMAVSGADALPNNHLFITHGLEGRLFEVDSQGEVLWEYLNPVFNLPDSNGRSILFKAQHYLPDYPAFEGREISPQEIVPLQFLNFPEAQDD